MQIHTVTRISIPIDDLGMFLQHVEHLDATTKRERKSKFRKGERTLRALQVIPPGAKVHAISTGVTSDGELSVEVSVTEQKPKRIKENEEAQDAAAAGGDEL